MTEARWILHVAAWAACLGLGAPAFAQIADSPHDFGLKRDSGKGTGKCAACHFPHTQSGQASLWDARTAPSDRYPALPGLSGLASGVSGSCASCHDEAFARMCSAADGEPHPVNVEYANLSKSNPRLVPTDQTWVGQKGALFEGKIECSTCHAVHSNKTQAAPLLVRPKKTLCASCHRDGVDFQAQLVHAIAPWEAKESHAQGNAGSIQLALLATHPSGDVGESPGGTAFTKRGLLVADLRSKTLRRIDVSRGEVEVLHSADAGGSLIEPVSVASGPDGEYYVADRSRSVVAVFDAEDTLLRELKTSEKPVGVAVGAGRVFVGEISNHSIEVFERKSGDALGLLAKGRFLIPACLAVAPGGGLWVSDSGKRVVERLESNGKPWEPPFRLTRSEWARPKGIATDPAGRVYAVDTSRRVLHVFDPAGERLTSVPLTGTPNWIAFDSSVPAKYQSVVPNTKLSGLLAISSQIPGAVNVYGVIAPPQEGSQHALFRLGDCDACHGSEAETLRRVPPTLCAECHEPGTLAPKDHDPKCGPVKTGACRSCHNEHQSRLPSLLRRSPLKADPKCAECHDG